MTAEPAVPVNPRDAALRLLVAKALTTYAAQAEKDARKDADEAQVFVPGDRLPVVSPLDRTVRLGRVTMSDPEEEAIIFDEETFVEWMVANHDDQCHDVGYLVGSQTEVIAALIEHCPPDVAAKFVTMEREPTPQARNAVLKLSTKEGQPVGPDGDKDNPPAGVGMRVKPAEIRVYPEKDAIGPIVDLWRARAVDPLSELTG